MKKFIIYRVDFIFIILNFAYAPVTLCRLGFPTRPDFEVGVCRGSVCLSRGELGIRRGRVGRVGIGREGTPTKYNM